MTTETPNATITQVRAEQHTVSSEPISQGGAILSTARAQGGKSTPGPLTEDHIVTVGGMEVTVRQAVDQLGALKRNPDGTFSEVDWDAVQQQRAEADAKHDAEAVDNAPRLEVDTEAARLLTNMVQGIEEMNASDDEGGGNPVACVAAFLANPEEIPPALMDVVRQRGYAVTDVKAELLKVASAIEEGLNEHVAKRGVDDPLAFYDYAKKVYGLSAFSNAITQAVFEGNLGGIDRFADAFVATGLGRASAPNTTQHHGSNGRTVDVVTLPNGMKTTREAARRLQQMGVVLSV
jgi:hypothetical protein